MIDIDEILEKLKAIRIEGYYLGVSDNDIFKISLFKEDKNMPNNMGELIKEYFIEDYNTETLEELREEMLEDLKEEN